MTMAFSNRQFRLNLSYFNTVLNIAAHLANFLYPSRTEDPGEHYPPSHTSTLPPPPSCDMRL